MKTIKEIAEEIGVSKQAVYKRYKGKLYKSMFPHVRNVSGTIYILDQGESIIKQDFFSDSSSVGVHTGHAQDALILVLEAINKQNTELTTAIKTLTESINSYKKTPPKKRKKQLTHRIKSAPIQRLIDS